MKKHGQRQTTEEVEGEEDLLRVDGTICGEDANYRSTCTERARVQDVSECHICETSYTSNDSTGDIESEKIAPSNLLVQTCSD